MDLIRGWKLHGCSPVARQPEAAKAARLLIVCASNRCWKTMQFSLDSLSSKSRQQARAAAVAPAWHLHWGRLVWRVSPRPHLQLTGCLSPAARDTYSRHPMADRLPSSANAGPTPADEGGSHAE